MLSARHAIFDYYDWPPPLTLIYTFSIILLVGIAFLMQRSATRARDLALDTLSEKSNRARQLDDKKLLAEINTVSKSVGALDSGAFAGLSANPLIRAILIPLGGAGAMGLMELVAPFVK